MSSIRMMKFTLILIFGIVAYFVQTDAWISDFPAAYGYFYLIGGSLFFAAMGFLAAKTFPRFAIAKAQVFVVLSHVSLSVLVVAYAYSKRIQHDLEWTFLVNALLIGCLCFAAQIKTFSSRA